MKKWEKKKKKKKKTQVSEYYSYNDSRTQKATTNTNGMLQWLNTVYTIGITRKYNNI